jgi:hypothetical protein
MVTKLTGTQAIEENKDVRLGVGYSATEVIVESWG